jgi:hypothetical protein
MEKITHSTPRLENLALSNIRDAAKSAIKDPEWFKSADARKSINPAMTMFLVNEIEQLHTVKKALSMGEESYKMGYQAGWEDALNNTAHDEPVMAWAIVDREREKVRFETSKPTRLNEQEVLIPLYVRPEGNKRK